jgi:hypothetical protein
MPRSGRVLWPLLACLLACLPACRDSVEPAAVQGSERDRLLGPFLAAHWELPVPEQGALPPSFSEPEASLDPATCGACHPEQLAQWQTSFHARAFSPGFAGQLIEGSLSTPFQLRSCQTCHTPLAEQQPYGADHENNPDHDAALRAQGIVCAACHVRSHRRFGPPRRAELPPLVEPVPHGGFEERPEFLESRFCAECHQFFDDEGANGKSLENTFLEWQASPQAEEGRHCQDCHMPDRAHLWRGIHDPDMVRSGVDTELTEPRIDGSRILASLVVANRDVGHAFPTYITPRVFLAIYQVDAAGDELEGTRVEAVIGRDVNLGTMEERSDTRVFPGESVRLDYDKERTAGGRALVGVVTVDPDFHYRGVFESLMERYTNEEALTLIAEAARQVSDSAYVLSETRREL